MRPFKFIVPLLAGAAFAADANSVNAAIQIINSATTQLGNDASLYNGGVPGLPYALQVQLDALYVYKVVKAGTSEANASNGFGEPGSATIAATLLQTSQIVQKALQNIQDKAPLFADLQPLVLSALYQLRYNTNTFSTAITRKLAPIEALAAPAVAAQLTAAFNKAIVAYGGTPSAIEKRDARTVLNDISNINSKLVKLQNDVNALQTGFFTSIQALQIQGDANDLDAAIKQASNDAAASSNFNDSDSVSVANAVTALQPAIYNALNSLIAKKQVFQTAVFGAPATGLVKNSLTTLRADTATFSSNVVAKLVPILRRSAPLISSNVDFHFERAIEAFS